jgi:mannosyltransferase OCH1-like enzyme
VPSQRSCINLHPDYEYKLWTDSLSREFIRKEYAWFLETFDSYPFPIQRADAIRYFVLDHYGGIYLDLDDGCARRLDVMLEYPAWLRSTLPKGISNDAMGSVPHHPFFKRVIESLENYANNYGMPYITVMSSTRPLFLSIMWKQYMSIERPLEDHVRVLMPPEYRNNKWSIFYIVTGNSWHGKDAQTIFWLGKH